MTCTGEVNANLLAEKGWHQTAAVGPVQAVALASVAAVAVLGPWSPPQTALQTHLQTSRRFHQVEQILKTLCVQIQQDELDVKHQGCDLMELTVVP